MPIISPVRPMPPPTDPDAMADEQHAAFDGQLREHAERPQWGLAIRVWSRGDRRGYQFEDGKLRIIAEQFDHKMRAVTRAAAEAERLHAALWKLSGLTQARVDQRRGGKEQGACSVTFDEQLSLFLSDYPDGFADPTWLRDVRGAEAARRSTRHRDPAIAAARALLGNDELAPLIESQDYSSVISRAAQALEGCSLVSGTQGALLTSLHPANERGFAVALVECLHGEEAPERSFERLVASLASSKRAPSWPLITAFAALVHPEDQICIKPSVFQQQARVLAPGLTLERRPNYVQYEHMRTLAESITHELLARQRPPQDWMDVHDFVWATMRPAAVKRIEAMKVPPAPPT
jgi:hypothetical protein